MRCLDWYRVRLCFQGSNISEMYGNINSFKELEIWHPNANKSSNVLQSLFNDTKPVDYG